MPERTTIEQRGLRILAYTSLFPNRNQPLKGLFIWQRLAHLARRNGNECTVVAPVPYAPAWLPSKRLSPLATVPFLEKSEQLTVYHPRYFLLPKVSMPLHGWLMFLGTYSVCRRLHRDKNFDMIDAHYIYPDGYAATLLGKLLKLPVVVSARGTDINLFPSFPTIRPMIRWTLHEALAVITVSQGLKQSVVDLGIAPQKISTISNGIDSKRFFPVEQRDARRQLGIATDALMIVSVGGLVSHKGFHLLLPAVAQLATTYPQLAISIVGEGPDRNLLQQLIGTYALQERVSLVGSRPNEELKYWYSAADLSCLLSSREGYPNVVVESLACGTPVVATRVGGIPEVLTSEELGIIVEQTPSSIVSGLRRALEKRWDRAAIASRMRTRTWEKVGGEVDEFLRAALRQEREERLA